MANTNSPFGFKWLGAKSGRNTYSLVPRKIAAANNTPIYRGDLVHQLSTGYIGQSAAGDGNAIMAGIFYGVEYLSTSQGRQILSTYWPNGDHAYDGQALIIPIANDVPQLFMAQSNGAAITFANVGDNIDIVVNSGSVTSGYGVSGMALDPTTIATTGTLPFRIYDLYSNYGVAQPGQTGLDNTSNYNIVVVESNPFGVAGV